MGLYYLVGLLTSLVLTDGKYVGENAAGISYLTETGEENNDSQHEEDCRVDQVRLHMSALVLEMEKDVN